MLSRLMLRNVGAYSGRTSVRPQAITAQCFHTNPQDTEETRSLIKRWDECNQKFYGPERDKVNFPHPTLRQTHDPVRLGFIPKSWFDAFYPKTGVSGPYLFVGGLTTFLMSKEILVVDHYFPELLSFWIAVYFITKKWGKSISGYLVNYAEQLDEKNWNKPMTRTRTAFANHVTDIDQKVVEEDRHKYVYDVQRENLDLQLEARYRERIAQVHNAVKKRLDYQVELLNTKKRFEQQHMVDWIVSNVVKGITPQQEKDAINSCISNLKVLAKQHQAA